MKHSTVLCALLTASAWLLAAPLHAQPAMAVQPAVGPPPPAVSAPAAKPAPKAKAGKKKRGKKYSRATLSAFQPLPVAAAQAAVVPAGLAPIALSPVVKPAVASAVQPRETPLPELPGGEGSTLALPLDAALPYDEESSLAQHERPIDAPVGDNPALGQESVSVIDRFADKPKARPLSNGPLKVRMKDSGLRASVQIPLDGEK